jgi:hypothetical protein
MLLVKMVETASHGLGDIDVHMLGAQVISEIFVEGEHVKAHMKVDAKKDIVEKARNDQMLNMDLRQLIYCCMFRELQVSSSGWHHTSLSENVLSLCKVAVKCGFRQARQHGGR